MENGLFAPHVARAIIAKLDEQGEPLINVLFCAKNNACEEIVNRAVDGIIIINVSRKAVHDLTFDSFGIRMTLAFDGVQKNVTFMPEDLLGIHIPIPGTEKSTWCYMLNDIDDQLRLLSSASIRTACSSCSGKPQEG